MERKRPSPEDTEDTAETKRFKQSLLTILDDELDSNDRNPADSDELVNVVMRSLKDEIGFPASDSGRVAGISGDSGSDVPELGFLLEASDDELGLPPTLDPNCDENNSTEDSVNEINLASSSSVYGEDLLVLENGGERSGLGWVGFEEEIRGYDLHDFGFSEEGLRGNNGKEGDDGVLFGGLFDYSDEISDDQMGFWLRHESLPAL
ncbi:hypothetical protein AMTRI_Chr13g118560 [Amborella trichopoda]|uniref:Uncharacterized protein n=1 Tax=Amborella trichopoda TaxID=13333 RepID=W1P7M9_AMBTC|nr:uncharacterized protein LOC18432093 [Amborella trichopoda]ERN03938.1 hypothetical protein AMTR_s00079p00027120 [Amborella trichopoda]|eukprot:XP_006842263.1 uncharacterized protein LOC18432093 [Amborella trichopoda]